MYCCSAWKYKREAPLCPIVVFQRNGGGGDDRSTRIIVQLFGLQLLIELLVPALVAPLLNDADRVLSAIAHGRCLDPPSDKEQQHTWHTVLQYSCFY